MADETAPEPAAASTPPPAAPPPPATPAPDPKPTSDTSPPATAPAPKRHILRRIFAISLWGAFKLLVLCVIAGFGVMLFGETQRSTQANVANAAGQALQQAWIAAQWLATNFWRPALYGAGVVLPIWTLWRVISLPFRK